MSSPKIHYPNNFRFVRIYFNPGGNFPPSPTPMCVSIHPHVPVCPVLRCYFT